MDDAVHVVTELWVRREMTRRTRLQYIDALDEYHGRATGLTEMTVYHWELRKHEPRGANVELLEGYHDVDSLAELGLGHEWGSAANWTWGTDEEMEGEVDRRLVMKTLGAAGAEKALLPVGPLVQAAQLLGGRPRIQLGNVRMAERVATRLTREYVAAPSHERVRAAAAHARTLMDRLRYASMTDATRARLAAVASDAAAFAGHTAVGAGQRVAAARWFQDAIELARQAGDRRLEALAIASTAWTASESMMPRYGDRSASLEALQAAAALDRSLPPAGRAWVNGYLSRELAAAKDDAASGLALERALGAAARAGRDEPGWGWWSAHGELSGWDGARVTVFTGLRPLYLGRYADAVPLLEGALEGTVVPVRRATLHADLTRASVGLDDPERARAEALAALDEADTHGLGITVQGVREMRLTFPPHWPLSMTEEIDERLALP